VRETIREHARSNRLAGDQVFFDQGGKQDFGPRIEHVFVGGLKIWGTPGHKNNRGAV
jgi:hypothetical protein